MKTRRWHLDFFWLFVRRDLNMRYAGSALGALWNLIHPLILIAIYMIIFSSLMKWRSGQGSSVGKVDYGTLTYGVHLCAGLIPWLLFVDTVTRSVGALIENSNFLQKVAFPPGVLFCSIFFNSFWIYGAGYLMFLGLLVVMGYGPPLAALAGLGLMLLLGITALGMGFVLAGLNVFIRDTAQVLNVALQVLFWLSPIVYFKEMFAPFRPGAETSDMTWLERLAPILVGLNPFERYISATQWIVGQSAEAPSVGDWILMLGLPTGCLVGGVWLFLRMLPDVRDNL